ncbi:hypothetical protein OG946_19070 [Streptomyces sp. NBC_01808]|uniref:hypothetical protein n=1 Tax=Streptomyces sp. NBC_01808 TaxID=2975947 RepID=UPI002DDB6A7C|nr:hypothetical protein [Streptomyces sp. NBC_01808]WSA39276.1 hypothetical protein OG946_19070 [Streptomyces sp. NBC_01808]
MVHVEKYGVSDEDPSVDGYVVNPPTVKEMFGFNSLDEAYEMIQAAAQLGFGYRLSNVMRRAAARSGEGSGGMEEAWQVDILEDVPLDPDELESGDEDADGVTKRPHS